jgi:hypothetical protein
LEEAVLRMTAASAIVNTADLNLIDSSREAAERLGWGNSCDTSRRTVGLPHFDLAL